MTELVLTLPLRKASFQDEDQRSNWDALVDHGYKEHQSRYREPPGKNAAMSIMQRARELNNRGAGPSLTDEQRAQMADHVEGLFWQGHSQYRPSPILPPRGVDNTSFIHPDHLQHYNRIFGNNPEHTPHPDEFQKAMTGGYEPHYGTSWGEHDPDRNHTQLEWSGVLQDPMANKIANMTRAISRDRYGNLTAHHDYLKIPEGIEGKGIGKQILGSQMDFYRNNGFNNIKLNANIDVGQYAWAKYGFLPHDNMEWRNLSDDYKDLINRPTFRNAMTPEHREAVEPLLNHQNPKAIWALSDLQHPFPKGGRPGAETSKLGKEIMLNGPDWNGNLDLDNHAQNKRFDKYISRK